MFWLYVYYFVKDHYVSVILACGLFISFIGPIICLCWNSFMEHIFFTFNVTISSIENYFEFYIGPTINVKLFNWFTGNWSETVFLMFTIFFWNNFAIMWPQVFCWFFNECSFFVSLIQEKLFISLVFFLVCPKIFQ